MTNRSQSRPKHFVKAEQFEFPIDGGFALIIENGIDYQRIADEKAASEEAANLAANLQTDLFE